MGNTRAVMFSLEGDLRARGILLGGRTTGPSPLFPRVRVGDIVGDVVGKGGLEICGVLIDVTGGWVRGSVITGGGMVIGRSVVISRRGGAGEESNEAGMTSGVAAADLIGGAAISCVGLVRLGLSPNRSVVTQGFASRFSTSRIVSAEIITLSGMRSGTRSAMSEVFRCRLWPLIESPEISTGISAVTANPTVWLSSALKFSTR